MSEEKLYAVKNDEGLFLLYSEQGAPLWRVWGEMFADKPAAERAAHAESGHVVTLIEEPEKLVLTKEQAKIVEGAHNDKLPACYISSKSDDEDLLMNAYVNGYIVAKEKKYGVKVPHTCLYYWKKLDGGLSINDLFANDGYDAMKFTEAEIEHYGLQDCDKEEVTNDDE